MENQARKPRIPGQLWALLAMNLAVPPVCVCSWKYELGVSARMALEAGVVSVVFLNTFFLLVWRRQKKAAQGTENRRSTKLDRIRIVLLLVCITAAFWAVAEPIIHHRPLGDVAGSGTVASGVVLVAASAVLVRDRLKKSAKNSK